MEHVSVIVRNTFIEIERPADPASARRSVSLPHAWRFRDYADSLISACTRLAIPNAVDQSETPHVDSQSAANSSISTVKPQEPLAPQIPAEVKLFHMERNSCAMRLNALDLFVPRPRASGRVGSSASQVAPKGPMISASLCNVRSRSRSASSDESRCSGNSFGSKTTGCGSGSDMGSATSDAGSLPTSVESPSNAVRVESVTPVPSPNDSQVVAHVSGSRRSRRRRAAARKTAEPGQLRIHAPVFQPVAHPMQQTCPISNETMDMVSVAQASILSCPHVVSVQIVKPVLPETRATSIVVSFHPGKVWERDVRTLAKNAFLEAAEKSQQVFILGYGVEPFVEDRHDGFTATIGSVPVDRQHAICWDFWQKGFCQRLSTCRWCHPGSSDLMDVKFVFEPAQVPVQQPQSFWNGPGCLVDFRCAPANWMACST